jgi:hypothetical protein
MASSPNPPMIATAIPNTITTTPSTVRRRLAETSGQPVPAVVGSPSVRALRARTRATAAPASPIASAVTANVTRPKGTPRTSSTARATVVAATPVT